MALGGKLVRFARKPLSEKRAAVIATFRSFQVLHRHIRNAFMHLAAERNNFDSGLGDSANLLYGLVRSMKPEVCVEIGSAQGKSACYIGMALKENGRGKLYAIDPHTITAWNDARSVNTFDIFTANITSLGLRDQVTVIRSTSDAAARNWDRPIDVIFIDGDHSYEGVKRDWELFSPHVRPFGIVVFHDTMWELSPYRERMRGDMGVPRFVDELRMSGYQVLTFDKDYGFSLVQPLLGGHSLKPKLVEAASDPAKSFAEPSDPNQSSKGNHTASVAR